MHLHFERTINTNSDCEINSLSWMGKVPDELPLEDDGWKLNRNNYYQEGWLATGNIRGIVGVTFTTSHCKKMVEFPSRTNFNLRGHRAEVILVKWNEPYQKLASCDSDGIIFVWIKYEGRWSIELINDRNTPVTHFSWSHDGKMALICYEDGFVLVGSVAGQRYWSSMLTLDSVIRCGIWTPDDQQVYFGTGSGQIIVMDVNGAMVSQVQLTKEAIHDMAWSCEKFKLDDAEEDHPSTDDKKFVLAVILSNDEIYLLTTFDDVAPIKIDTGFSAPLRMEWSNSRELLAVSGRRGWKSYAGLKFYNDKGTLIYKTRVPTEENITTMTWGHNDKRLFLAAGSQIHIAWVGKKIGSLQLLCRLKIYNLIPHESLLCKLPLPIRLRNNIGNHFTQTIRCCVPLPSGLREFVSRPPSGTVRLHCTMIRHNEDCNASSSTCYTLYLEFLGGLVPLLKGRRISKIRPEFIIFDPQDAILSDPESDNSDYEWEGVALPRIRLKRKKKQKSANEPDDEPDLSYVDTLPEKRRLVEVTSNIWGTKFKIHGLANILPANLGQVTYKTSLLHLQPRQMTLVITELRDDFPVGPDPTFNPNVFSEDEEEQIPSISGEKPRCSRLAMDNCPPIAPMSPRTSALNKQKSFLKEEPVRNHCHVDSLPREEKCTFVEIEDHVRPQNLIRPSPNSQNSTSFIGPLGKSNGQNQKHAISPICCEVSVPALQSPKNAVAPSDIIFDRPSAPTIISYSSNSSATLQVKPYFEQHSNNKNDISVSFNINSGDQKPIALRKKETSSSEAGSSQAAKVAKSEEDVGKNATDDIPSGLPHMFAASVLMTRSCSVGYLDMVDAQMVPPGFRMSGLNRGENPNKRLILVNNPKDANKKRHSRLRQRSKMNPQLKNFGKSKSLDSSDIFISHSNNSPNFVLTEKIPEQTEPGESSLKKEIVVATIEQSETEKKVINNNNINAILVDNSCSKVINNNSSPTVNNNRKTAREFFSSPLMRRKKDKDKGKTKVEDELTEVQKIAKLKALVESTNPYRTRLPRSSPSSPAPSKKCPNSPTPCKKNSRPQSASPIRRKLMSSPFLRRRNKNQESSDEEANNASGDEIFNGTNYKDLETFQKSQLRQKLKRGKIEPNGGSCCNNNQNTPQRREFVMHNKAPMWNENSQVYQLDFGGRVTQESAKNFQIEFRGKQVMQFGRIDSNAYTLDFQYPFSALQAFAVALANVTQRLK